jgi:hypothetical protein
MDSNLRSEIKKKILLFSLLTLVSSAIERLTSSFFISSSLLQKTRKVIHKRIQIEAKNGHPNRSVLIVIRPKKITERV